MPQRHNLVEERQCRCCKETEPLANRLKVTREEIHTETKETSGQNSDVQENISHPRLLGGTRGTSSHEFIKDRKPILKRENK